MASKNIPEQTATYPFPINTPTQGCLTKSYELVVCISVRTGMSQRGSASPPARIGVDVGGTFTDILLVDAKGHQWQVKVRSTPKDPSRAVVEGVLEVLNIAGLEPGQVECVLHGTTVGTNAVLERRGAKVSLIVTKGFEDLLEIGRQQRPSLYDLTSRRAPPLVPRERCFGVDERVAADGSALKPLKDDEASRVAWAAGEGVEAVAVCLLFSFLNPAHEEMLGERLHLLHPEVNISLSHRVLPEFREYERLSTTVLDAYITPVLSRYLKRLEGALRRAGVESPLLLMQGNGGVLHSEAARQRAVRLLLSGLAAGALAGRYTGQLLGQGELITLDMGGTSTDVSLITGGELRETTEGNVGGLPCRVPMVDVETVGAGGGSIAWIDEGGVLRVGPRSAGADPGPCCYGMGGQEPTVTDANLLLGRLNPHNFLGGRIPLDSAPAREQVGKLASRLGLKLEECALGIIRVVNAAMARAIRLVSLQRGHDPRRFTLVAFGGAGPMHAWALAQELGIPRVLVPPAPGLHSALGLLVTHLRCDHSRTILQPADGPDFKLLSSTYLELEEHTRSLLRRQGVPDHQITIQRLADLRYRGQAYELTLPTPRGKVGSSWLKALLQAFHQLHRLRYGYAAPQAPVTIVTLRVVAHGPRPELRPPRLQRRKTPPQPKETRPVFFEEAGCFLETPIYDRSSLGLQTKLAGPAVIEQLDTTILLHPGTRATMLDGGNLLIEAEVEPK